MITQLAGAPEAVSDRLADRYLRVRSFSEELCRTLESEDYVVQSMADAGPTKWHLAHTSWFFETFILEPHVSGYVSFDPRFRALFNSYYNSLGKKHARPLRGTLSRPTVADTFAYRVAIDDRMYALLARGVDARIEPLVVLGLHHEQQHQELMVTDIKHVFSMNPLGPVFRERTIPPATSVPNMEWFLYEEGIRYIGHDGDAFSFDNEGPRHRELVQAFSLGSRLVTNAEYQQFIEDGGYHTPTLWLSDGWNVVQAQGWDSPLYWSSVDGGWQNFTLSGLRSVQADEPVTHVSYYEADAFARWAGARLAGEAEWEFAAQATPVEGNFVDNGAFHPVPLGPRSAHEAAQRVSPDLLGDRAEAPHARPAGKSAGYGQTECPSGADGALEAGGWDSRPLQLYGDVWEWTRGAYLPYPGYQPASGALGEYNGKFMCNQFVLRGGSCATSRSHIRATYRNFFPPDARWQFTGIRLAKDS